MFARSTALRSLARQTRNFSSTSAGRAAAPQKAQEKAVGAVNDIAKRAQELGAPVVKRVEGLLGGK